MATFVLSPSQLVAQVRSLSKLSFIRQLIFMVIMACSIALGISVVLWSRDEDYMVLYPQASTQDNAEIVTLLDQNQIRYKINSGSGLVSVPNADAQKTRLMLASQGLPRAANNGYESLDEAPALGTSNFVEQTRYNRALEQELVTTIKLIRGVRDARVHLSIPKQTSFLRTGNKPSASVMLDIIGGQAISDIQIAGIAHLVSSSVAGMDSSDVSIVDQKGSLLSRQHNADFQSSAEHLQFTREIEQEYTKRILAILTPLVGDGRVRAQVSADLDFTVEETTEENYDPNTVVVRSEQTQQENRAASSAPLPGTLSQTPPTGAQITPEITANQDAAAANAAAGTANPANQSSVNATRNYEIDRSVSHRRSVPGSINRLSVAVVVDLQPAPPKVTDANPDAPPAALPPPDPALIAEKIERMTRLVKDTIGYSETRGDSVNVISEVFTAEAVMLDEVVELPLWEQPWVWSLGRQAGSGIIVLILIFSVLRPAMKSVIRPVVPAANKSNNNSGQPQQLAAISLGATPEAAQQAQLPAKSVYDENLQMAQQLVKSEPAKAARMVKEWVNNG
jgi:flagellar M-ring protein FliF